MICIYHKADLDGICSGAILKYKYPDATMIGYNHNDPFDINIVKKDEKIIFADILLSMFMMRKLKEITNNIVIYDHHKSSYNDYINEFGFEDAYNFHYGVGISISACEVVWMNEYPIRDLPEAIKLIGDYDIYRSYYQHKAYWDSMVLPFHYGLSEMCSDIDTFPTYLFTDSDVCKNVNLTSLTKNGFHIMVYLERFNESLAKHIAHEKMVDGHLAICMNVAHVGSDVFNSVYTDKYDLMITYYHDGNKWLFTFYTKRTDLDCSLIAKKFGGGGHPQAAGCKVNDLNLIFN